jgi:hypothetical protein
VSKEIGPGFYPRPFPSYPYSPECLEGVFSEVSVFVQLRSSRNYLERPWLSFLAQGS